MCSSDLFGADIQLHMQRTVLPRSFRETPFCTIRMAGTWVVVASRVVVVERRRVATRRVVDDRSVVDILRAVAFWVGAKNAERVPRGRGASG